VNMPVGGGSNAARAHRQNGGHGDDSRYSC
jgi:hypothetical protein